MSDDLNLDMGLSGADGGVDTGKKKKLSFKLMIILGVLVMVLAGGGAAWFFFSSSSEEEPVDAPSSVKENVKPVFENIYSLEAFSINLADMGGRVFKVRIDLDLADPATRREIDRRVVQLRGAAGMILKSKTMDEIDTVSGKIRLKTEIIKRMNMMLETGKIRNIYLSEFVIL